MVPLQRVSVKGAGYRCTGQKTHYKPFVVGAALCQFAPNIIPVIHGKSIHLFTSWRRHEILEGRRPGKVSTRLR